MPFTKCPKCRKVHLVAHELMEKEVGCLSPDCDQLYHASEYRLHSNILSKLVFFLVILFAIYLFGCSLVIYSTDVMCFLTS